MIPVAEARREADAAADAAGVVVDAVATPDELDELRATMDAIWGPEIVPPRNLLRGMALGGACLIVARPADRGGAPIGFALGFIGWEGGIHLHSHQVGVRSEGRKAGIGVALKLAQRALCLEHGVTEMRWTFDPMLAANARFNLVRLGATVVGFHPHCYGDRRDAFNTGERTDRLEVSWRLDRPVGGALVPIGDRRVVTIPTDYPALRTEDPDAAAVARRLVGDALADCAERGVRILGLAGAAEPTVGYVVEERA